MLLPSWFSFSFFCFIWDVMFETISNPFWKWVGGSGSQMPESWNYLWNPGMRGESLQTPPGSTCSFLGGHDVCACVSI